MPWHTTHELYTSASYPSNRYVRVQLQRDLPAAPATVEPLPVLAPGPVVDWTFSDRDGFGVLSRTAGFDVLDRPDANAPHGLARLLEEAEPDDTRLRITGTGFGVGVAFEGPLSAFPSERPLWKGRRRVSLQFADRGVRSGPLPSSLYSDFGTRNTLAALVEALLWRGDWRYAPEFSPGHPYPAVWYAHPWRSQAAWPNDDDPISFLHQVWAPWRETHGGGDCLGLVQAICRAAYLRVGFSTTLNATLAVAAHEGWGGADVVAAPPADLADYGASPRALAVQPVGVVHLDAGRVRSERGGYVRVAPADGPDDGGTPGQSRDRLGVVRDSPGERGDPGTGHRSATVRLAFATEPGDLPDPYPNAGVDYDGPAMTEALAVRMAPPLDSNEFRAVGQVFGVGVDDPDACLQFEDAHAARLWGRLGKLRGRVSLRVPGFLDPVLPFRATLPGALYGEEPERVFLPVEGRWFVMAGLTVVEAVEQSVVGEVAPAAPAAWYEVVEDYVDDTPDDFVFYGLSIRSNRRLSSLTLGLDRLDSGVWSEAEFVGWNGAPVTSVALADDPRQWSGIEPERKSWRIQNSVHGGATCRWRLDRDGVSVWTGEPFVVPA